MTDLELMERTVKFMRQLDALHRCFHPAFIAGYESAIHTVRNRQTLAEELDKVMAGGGDTPLA